MKFAKKGVGIFYYFAFVFGVIFSTSFPPEVAHSSPSSARILVNKHAKTEHVLSIRELIDIFTRRKTHWSDRTEILVLTQGIDTLPNRQFLIEVLGITPYQYRSRLGRNTYSGRVLPPFEVSSEEEMIDKLIKEPSAIGYLYNYILYKDDDRLVIINVTE